LDSSDEDWTTEKITYTAAYGMSRQAPIYFLPKKFKRPLQTVLCFPGDSALFLPSLPLSPAASRDAILRSGRSVLDPVYKGTYERPDGTKKSAPSAKDASRAIDYAETRPDLDHEKLPYCGFSCGADLGGIIPATDPRIRVCIFALGGLLYQRPLPEVDNINFLLPVKLPVLMMNGRYDFMYPVESSQQEFLQRLASRNEFIKETLNWLDQYLGPAQ